MAFHSRSLGPGSDAISQDALDGAAIEPFDDLRTYAKSFQSPEGELVLSCLLHDWHVVLGPCSFVGDVDTKELEALTLLHCSPIDEMVLRQKHLIGPQTCL